MRIHAWCATVFKCVRTSRDSVLTFGIVLVVTIDKYDIYDTKRPIQLQMTNVTRYVL